MLTFLLASTVPVTTVALLNARWEYLKRGRLTLVGMALLCAMLFMPNLVLEYATTDEMPGTVLEFVGVLVGGAGLVLCLVSIAFFRSGLKVLCLDAGNLTSTGPNRWSRNPQYVGWFLFLLGYALNDWSLWCLAALMVIATSLHLLVLSLEERLRQQRPANPGGAMKPLRPNNQLQRTVRCAARC